jgi:hypothetical protein
LLPIVTKYFCDVMGVDGIMKQNITLRGSPMFIWINIRTHTNEH